MYKDRCIFVSESLSHFLPTVPVSALFSSVRFKMPNPSKDSNVPCNLCARNAIIESLSGRLSALAADVEELHARLCVTHLTLEEDGFSSSASWVVAVALDTR
jgi:hypothetical protein